MSSSISSESSMSSVSSMSSISSSEDKTSVFREIFNEVLEDIGSRTEFKLPGAYDKWLPKPYQFIRRNVYHSKKMKKKEDDGIFCSCESSSGSSGVCDKDCHCGMLLSACSSACKCGSSCQNKPFQNRSQKKMKLVQTERCGSGIVADEDIKCGEFVIEYVGEVIDDKTCEERLWKMKHTGQKNFYLCEINRDLVIDATYKGNKSRFINHSCDPNTEMQKWIIDGETRIGIFSIKDIKKGEQLTYDYKFVQFGPDQPCHCGAEGCRQKLGFKTHRPPMSSDETLKLVTAIVNARSAEAREAGAGSSRSDESNSPPHKSDESSSPPHKRQAVSEDLKDPNDPMSKKCTCVGKRLRMPITPGPSGKCYRYGHICRYNVFTGKHRILFEGRQIEDVNLRNVKFEFITVVKEGILVLSRHNY